MKGTPGNVFYIIKEGACSVDDIDITGLKLHAGQVGAFVPISDVRMLFFYFFFSVIFLSVWASWYDLVMLQS